jgi:hypothetical protein
VHLRAALLPAALLRADMGKRVTPLSRCADHRRGAGSGAASASRGRLLTFGASSQHVLVRMRRVSQSNRHGNCKQRDGKRLQHRFFLPDHSLKKATKRGGLVCNTYAPLPSRNAARIFKANCGAADLDLNQRVLTRGGSASLFMHLKSASKQSCNRKQMGRQDVYIRPTVRSHADLSHFPKRAIRPGTH